MTALVEQSDVDRIRESVDLVALIGEHVPLQPRGREHVGVCPFHEDHRPSLTVVTHKGNAFYKCHACGAAGDAFTFLREYHGMSFSESLAMLAERTGVTLRRARSSRSESRDGTGRDDLRAANAAAAGFYRRTLLEDRRAAPARRMLQERRIGDETAEAFGIGCAPPEWESLADRAGRGGVSIRALADAGLVKPRSSGAGHYDTFRNRLIFPICDELGRPIAFGGRRLDPEDEPKYLNSPESPLFHKSRTVYALHLARRAIIESRQAIVTEGYTDVVACHQAGVRNVVATLGTAMTAEHVRLLARLCPEIVLVFDGDEAGQRAADRAVELMFAETVDVRICVLPDGADPAELLEQDDGPRRFAEALSGATDALEFKVRRFRGELAEAGGPAARHRRLEKLLGELADLGFHRLPGVRKQPVIAQLAELLDVRMQDVEQAMPRGRAAAPSAPTPAPAADTPADKLFTEVARVPKRRRQAERELLGAVIHQPALRHETLGGDAGDSLLARVQPGNFEDPMVRRLAELVAARLERDEDFTVQQLMGDLTEPQDAPLRGLASELYLDVERRLADGRESPLDHLRERCEAFDRLVRRERFDQDLEASRRQGAEPDGDPAETLRRLLEQRRNVGYIPEAIPTRART